MKKLIPTSLVSILLLSACGFQPMYGSHSASAQRQETGGAFSHIEIGNIPDREGQVLRNELVDRLNYRSEPVNARYALSFTKIGLDIRDLDLTKNSENTRSQVIAKTQMTLIDRDTGKAVLERDLRSLSSYNVLPSEFATNVTEENATSLAIRDLARQAEQQLSLYFNR